jgi:HAD superfamily hydrolase (TIGR01509 family)
MIKAAIFDVDGTLLDSNDLHVQAWQRSFADFGIVVPATKLHEQMGNGGDQVVKAFCSPDQVDELCKALIERHIEVFTRDFIDKVRPLPKVRELFEMLHVHGVRIALASSAQRWERDHYVKLLGVGHLLDSKTTADSAEHPKPSPDIFQAALAKLDGVAPREAVVVGDSPWDAIAARKAGMYALGVLSGGFEERKLREAGVAAVFRDVAHLLEHYEAERTLV